MQIERDEYEVVIATDVNRDSMQWECYRVNGLQRTLVPEVIRFDGRKEWEFVQHIESLPLAVVEYASEHARADLGPLFDG